MPSTEEARTAPISPVFVTTGQLAIMLQISKRTLWRWRSEGRLPPPVRLGGSVRWRMEEVMRWIDDGCPHQLRG